MKTFAITLLTLVASLLPVLPAGSETCDKFALGCEPDLFPYTYDGQYYKSELFPGEKAKMKFTFYSGMVYRLVPCGGAKTGEGLIVELYDGNGVRVFTNEKMRDEPFWDFEFGATQTYQLIIRYDKSEGCAAMLVGYLEQDKAKASAGVSSNIRRN